MTRYFMTLACGIALWLTAGQAQAAPPPIGNPAPPLRVTTFDGQTFDLGARRGRVVIVCFWATWCSPCRGELPVIDAFSRQYHARGLDIIALSTERSRARGDARKVAQQFSFPAGMLCDAKANGFGDPRQLPATYIIDTNGVIRARFLAGRPSVTASLLAETVLPLLPAPKTP